MYLYDNLLCYYVLNCFYRIVERKCFFKYIIVLRNYFKFDKIKGMIIIKYILIYSYCII